MADNALSLILDAQSMLTSHGCQFTAKYGPSAAPEVASLIDKIAAGSLAIGGSKSLTLEAILAASLRLMAQHVSGDASKLDDTAAEKHRRIMNKLRWTGGTPDTIRKATDGKGRKANPPRLPEAQD